MVPWGCRPPASRSRSRRFKQVCGFEHDFKYRHIRAPRCGSASWLARLADEPRLLMLLPGLFWAGNAIVARSVAGEVPPIGLRLLALDGRRPGRAAARLAARAPRRQGVAADWPIMLAAVGARHRVLQQRALSRRAVDHGAQHRHAADDRAGADRRRQLHVCSATRLPRGKGVGIAISLAGALTLISHGAPEMLHRSGVQHTATCGCWRPASAMRSTRRCCAAARRCMA